MFFIVPLVNGPTILAALNPSFAMLDQARQQHLVQLIEVLHFRNRHQKVPPCKTDQSLHSTFLLALCRIAEPGLERVVTPERREAFLLDPRLAAKNPSHRYSQIV